MKGNDQSVKVQCRSYDMNNILSDTEIMYFYTITLYKHPSTSMQALPHK